MSGGAAAASALAAHVLDGGRGATCRWLCDVVGVDVDEARHALADFARANVGKVRSVRVVERGGSVGLADVAAGAGAGADDDGAGADLYAVLPASGLIESLW